MNMELTMRTACDKLRLIETMPTKHQYLKRAPQTSACDYSSNNGNHANHANDITSWIGTQLNCVLRNCASAVRSIRQPRQLTDKGSDAD